MISPPFLKAGDTVCILSTARKIAESEVQLAKETLSSWGLKVVTSKFLFEIHHQFAGTDAQRLFDLQSAINNPEVKAILCARGGYGTSRILDDLDLSSLLNQPKWIIGFSDVTALHLHLQTHGIESIHGIMPIVFSKPGSNESIESLRKILFGESVSYTISPHDMNRLGRAGGELVGGNLSLINHLLGTASVPDWKGKILFLEDIDEYLYHIDRLFLQLKRAGVLQSLAGIIVGHFTDMKDNTVPFGSNAYEIIFNYIKDYNYPAVFGFPIGHEPMNMSVICGRESTLIVEKDFVQLLQ